MNSPIRLSRSCATLWVVLGISLSAIAAETPPDYLGVVRAYADCLIVHGQDTYGSAQSPLFAEALDRRTLKLLEGDALKRVAAMKFEEWGIRSHDRMLTAANPMHCLNFYQVLYALTRITGNGKYAGAADQSLKYFFERCQSPVTGLMYWGEHAGWDLRTDAAMEGAAANTHEFFRPWVLWERSWELAPDACRRFALGLWEHQIGDHSTGLYSRHAAINKHAPGTDAPYARHGGCYVLTWATAYARTKDPLFLKAIETVVNCLESFRRSGGMVVGGSTRTKAARAERDTSLAVSLWEAAPLVPPELAAKLREIARANDEPAAKPGKPAGQTAPGQNLWSDGYGASGGQIAGSACLRMMRHRQVPEAGYRERILSAAGQYLEGEINLGFPVHPGTAGKVICLLLSAHELTGERRYLDRADGIARRAMQLFMGDGCPLPKAAHSYDHYEAITGADTLMMSLLQLWAAEQQPPVKLPLVYTDR